MRRDDLLKKMLNDNCDALNANGAYQAWWNKSDARDRNRVAQAVNKKDMAYREKLDDGGKAYFDYLMKEADLYEEYGGVRPVFDMEELES